MSFEIKTGISRRRFFKWLGAGTAAVVVAPSALAVCADPWCGSIAGEGIIPHDELHEYPANISYYTEYADYTNFSSFALAASIDNIVANAAKELGEAAARDIASLHAQAFA